MGAVAAQCTIRRSPTTIASVSLSFSLAIRTTHKTHTAREHESERERVSGTSCTCDFILEKGVASEAGKTKTRIWNKSETAKLLAQRERRVKLFAKLLFCHKNKIPTIKKYNNNTRSVVVSSRLHPEANFRNRATISLAQTHRHTHSRTCNGQQ